MVCTQTDFIKRLKATLRVELAGLNRKMRSVALGSSPAGRQLENLAFEVGDNRAMRPCEHCRNNQVDTFAQRAEP